MPTAGAASRPLDVEIAIDTTGSMGPSIQQARENARQLIRDLRRIAPNLRVAIVQFRDSTDAPEYQVVQPMTASRAQIEAALNSLTAAGGGDAPEAHNLVFNRSYADPGNAIGWRANSRKIVIVISDQQPHGAGSAGIPNCTDTSADPNGLNTATELAGMRAAQRTLIMILQSSSAPAGLLDCYEAMADRAFQGGTAVNGDDDLVGVIDFVVGDAVGRRILVNVRAFANNVRNLPVFQLGRSRLNGSGIVLLRRNGQAVVPLRGQVLQLRDRDDLRDRRFSRHRVRVVVVRGDFQQFGNGVRIRNLPLFGRPFGSTVTIPGRVRVLTLVVRVVSTNLPGLCRRGTFGLIQVVDADTLIAGGRADQTRDRVETRFPVRGGPTRARDGGLSCRTHNHGWTNTNNPNTRPTAGGSSRGGHFAVVELTQRIG